MKCSGLQSFAERMGAVRTLRDEIIWAGECNAHWPAVTFRRKPEPGELLDSEYAADDEVVYECVELDCADYQYLIAIGAEVLPCADCPMLINDEQGKAG